MKRHAEIDLKNWFYRHDRRPLIIRGARQVGKSTLVKLFAEAQGLSLIEINLEKLQLTSVKASEFKMQFLLDEIQLKTKTRIQSNTLIFFDEIQESPLLLKYLRYFYEERPDIRVVAAGSLLEIALKNENFSFPVGRVEFYHLGPMSFTEFLWATGNDFLAEKLDALDLSPEVVTEAKKQLVNYYYVGGMPQVVQTFINEQSLVPVREIQEQIIQTYIADFPKYNARINVERVEKVFYATVNQLGKKLIYQRLDSESNSRDIKKALELLIDARVLLKCVHSESNTVPLAGEMDQSIFKLYFLDIGLVNAIMRLDFEIFIQEMNQNFNTKGMLAEQFVAQHLAYIDNERRGPQLFYWLRDKGTQKGEIDFILQKQSEIIPVEVKATATGHLKSLFYFCRDKNKKLAIKVSLDNYSVTDSSHQIEGHEVKVKLISLPQYAISSIYKITGK